MKWPTVPVGEIAQQVRGVSYDKSQVSNSAAPGLRPVLRAGNIQEGSLLLDKDLVYVPDSCIAHQQLLRPGDIVIAASSGSIDVVGKAAQLNEPWEGSFGAFCKVVRPSSDKVNARYLHHFFQSTGYRRKVSSLAAGANINNLKNEHIDDLLLPLPPLEEQWRIAAILDASQRISQLHSKRIIGLSALRQSLYRQLASQPGSQLLSLSSLAKITSGYAFKAADFCERGVHIIRMSDLNGEYVDLEGSAKVPPMAVAGLDRFELFEGDILLGMSGSLGKLGIVPTIPAGSRVFLNQRVAKISLAPDSSIDRELLIEAIKSKEYLSHLERCAAGVAVRNVSAAQMLDCLVPAPTPHEGHAFAEQCRLIGIQICRSEHCIAQSAALHASLSKGLLGMQ